MKYLQLVSGLSVVVLLSSFNKHDDKQAPDKHVGHVKSIRRVEYHATMDSAGNIYKGDVISDTDIVLDDPMYTRAPSLRRGGSDVPIEYWMYDESGNTIEIDKYHANGKLYHKGVFKYNGKDLVFEEDDTYKKNGSEAIRTRTTEYNANGKIIQQKHSECEPGSPCIYGTNRIIYDAKGFQSEVLVIDSTGPAPFVNRQVYVRDSAEHILENLFYKGDSTHIQNLTLNRYNQKGELIETDYEAEKEVRRGGPRRYYALAPEWKEINKYDDKGRLTDKIKYLPGNFMEHEEKIFFDTTDERTENYRYDDAGHFQGTDVKTTFKKDNTILEDKYDIDGMLIEYTMTHLDSAGNQVNKGTLRIRYKSIMGNDRRYHNQPPGDTVMVSQIVNNEHGDKTEEDTYSADGKISMQKTWEYNYDASGNWVQKIYLENARPVKIVEREIVYY